MKSLTLIFLMSATLLFVGCAAQMSVQTDTTVTVNELRCEYHTDPLGIDIASPRLSWIIESAGRNYSQSAYQVLVATTPEKLSRGHGDLWDSGKVKSNSSNQIIYEGRKLQSNMCCNWKVRVWDNKGNVSSWSEQARWTMGLLNATDWKAKWIGDGLVRKEKVGKERKNGRTVDKFERRYLPVTYLRKEFAVSKPIRRAYIYATALGLYELYINGERAGDDYFTPGWTEYQKRIYYRCYDVAGLVRSNGVNVIGATVGDGWYIMLHNMIHAGRQTGLLAQLHIEFADGTTEIIGTDPSWKMTTDGPVLSSDIYNGEHYDARKELTGWAIAGFEDSNWKPAVPSEDVNAILSAHPGAPIQKVMEIKPVEVTEPKPGVFVFNMGQNFSGWARLKVKGDAGIKVTLRFAEMLNPDGTVYTENLRSAKVTDSYILKGLGEEIWEPRFTYHGFQYVEVTGYPGKPDADAITGVVVYSNSQADGAFECSNPMLNKLYSNIVWGQRSNYFETPTDCPQRDERLGWTGDAQVFIRTGTYNMDVAAFFTSWLITLNDNQYQDGQYPVIAPIGDPGSSPGWSDAAIICPWVIYQVYGDTRILQTHYEQMNQWIEYMTKNSSNLLRKCWGFGDWLNLDAKETPKEVINTAYFAYSTSLMAKIATVLGRNEDAKKYEQLFTDIKKAFNDAYVDANAKVMGDTQTAYLLALSFNLLPKEKRALAAEHLIERLKEKNWHLSTGFLGVSLLLPTLTELGRLDIAYQLLTNETYPSWLYSVTQGATTVWERWNSYTKEKGFGDAGMNSFNHYAYGSAGQWMFSTVAGIDTDGPGFRKITIRPRPGGNLTFVKASYKSVNGDIAAHWRIEGDKLKLDVTIPANTTATIYIPAKEAESVTESGIKAAQAQGLTFLRVEQGNAVFTAGSGQYKFESQI